MRVKKKYRFRKVILWIVAIVLFNLIGLLVALQIPAIQTELAQYLSRKLSVSTGFTISVNSLDIDWLDRFKLQGLIIIDEEGKELLTLDELKVNYRFSSIIKGDIRLDDANISGLSMSLYKNDGDTLNISKLINKIKSNFKSKKDTTRSIFIVDYLTIATSDFSYVINNQVQESNIFNPSNFKLIDINGSFQSLQIVSDTIKLNVKSLETKESNTGLQVHKMSTHFLISPRQMRFDSVIFDIGKSSIANNIVFNYDSYRSLSSFTDSVSIVAFLDNTVLNTADMAHFIPYFNRINDNYLLSGSFNGEVSDFSFRKLDLEFGNGSKLAGSVYLSGLPNVSETFLDIKLKNSRLFERDLEQYIPSKGFKEYNRFKRVQLNASFTGYVDDFVSYGTFNTDLGVIVSDINLKISDKPEDTFYNGKLKLNSFDLGTFFDQKSLGSTTLNGNIIGTGFQLVNTSFTFNGSIDSIRVYDHNYSNITTSGKFEQQYFSGDLEINDPNLKLKTKNVIDLRNNANKIKVLGELELANLHNLNIDTDHAIVKSKIEADLEGFHIDSIRGYVYLEDFYAENNDQKLQIGHLTINSQRDKNIRTAELITERINVYVEGDFNYSTAYKDLKYMANEYILSLINNKDSIGQYYIDNPTETITQPYSIKLKAEIGDINRFLKLFEPGLSMHSTSNLDIVYKHDRTSTLAFNFFNDSLTFNGTTALNNNINLDASKVIGKPEILAAADIQSSEQIFSNGGKLENLIISAIWDNNKIDFNWYNTQKNIQNINDIYGEVFFYKDSTQIHLNRSNLSLLDDEWTIQDNNFITLTNDLTNIRNLNIYSQNQMLSISGILSRDPSDILAITANNLNVGLVNPIISKNLSGQLSGEFALSSVYDAPAIVSNFYINGFAINQFLVGNIFSSNDWNNNQKTFDIQFIVNRDDTPVILVDGIFDPFNKANALDLKASFMNAKLNMTEPFIETLFSEIQGSITGDMHITGPIRSPIISGLGSFNNAELKVNYLNTIYMVEGTWAFDSSAIYLNQLQLTDRQSNIARLDGVFTHTGFKKFVINLNGDMQKFEVLNTTSRDNDLFYGTGFATGSLSITGPIEDITIKSQAKTEKGTKFYLPIGGSNSSEFEDYITFIEFSDTLKNINAKTDDEAKIRGLNMEFDLDITKDAYAEIIFDINSGDIIRGRGNGHLSMNIDTNGEFSMIGSYEFLEGGYNFTMYNIVNKEFTINPKSKITWSGDPYNGVMDIDASYKLSTKLNPLVDTIYHDMPELNRIYPTEVLLSLDGPLLTPDIEFQIIIDDYPKSNVDLDTQIKGFLNTIATDEQELNRQVFSLLILRKFSSPNSFSGTGTIGSSVSEFVSNQLSYWISQVDENLTIDMDLGELDDDALNTFQLRVSYAFMDGKLIVTRDGGFTDANNDASVGSIAGDWTLEYLLSDDGKLRVKIFNKTNYNQLNSSTGSASQALITGGFSLIYTTSFDSLGELFKNPKKKGKEKEKDLEPTSSGLKPEEIDINTEH